MAGDYSIQGLYPRELCRFSSGKPLIAFVAVVQQVLETAFKNETVGLVTREEFIQKRTTLEERCVCHLTFCGFLV